MHDKYIFTLNSTQALWGSLHVTSVYCESPPITPIDWIRCLYVSELLIVLLCFLWWPSILPRLSHSTCLLVEVQAHFCPVLVQILLWSIDGCTQCFLFACRMIPWVVLLPFLEKDNHCARRAGNPEPCLMWCGETEKKVRNWNWFPWTW